MANDIKYRDILYDNRQIGPYPSDKLKRVGEPTVNVHVGPHLRPDERDSAFGKAMSGEYGERVRKMAPLMTVTEPIGAALTSVQRHLNEIRNNPVAEKKAPIPEDPRVLARHVKSMGIFLGADQVGICEVPEWAVFTHDAQGNEITKMYKYAIVLLARKNLSTVVCSSGYDWIFDPVSFQAYQRLACQTETMANYIRRLGFEADVSNMFTYQTVMIPLVLMAGLGEASKMSSAVNPFLGSNFKAAAVLTDMPLAIDKPIDIGLQEYCARCTICQDVCPTKSIKGNKTVYNGYEVWEINVRGCQTFNVLNKEGCVCGRCSKNCPWGGAPEEYEGWDGSIEWLHAKADAKAEQLRASGFKDPREETDKWWFDLERVGPEDKTLKIPDTSARQDDGRDKK